MTTNGAQKFISLVSVLGLSVPVFAACGGSQQQADAPQSSEETSESLSEKAPSVASDHEVSKKFADMSAPEKMNHMKTVVTPGMAKVFQESGDGQYAKFGCATCHGSGVKRGNFSMPSAELPALDDAVEAAHPEVTKFMIERVLPEMAKMLGEEPYNAENQTGFGCLGCHTKKE